MLNKQGRVGEAGLPCKTSCLGDESADRNCDEQISALRTDQDKNQRVGFPSEILRTEMQMGYPLITGDSGLSSS